MVILQLLFFGFATLALCLQTSSFAFSSGWSTSTNGSESEFVINGMANERERLKSGICTMKYVETNISPAFSDRKSASLHFWFAKDGRYRTDCTMPKKPRTLLKKSDGEKSSSPQDNHTPSESDIAKGYLIHTKDRNIGWIQGTPDIQITPPENPWPNWIPYFDVKAFGTNSWIELQRGVSWDQRLKLWLGPSGLPTATTFANDIYTMTWQLGNENREWVIEVNTERGFTPFHGFLRRRKDKKSPWFTVQEIKTTWEQNTSVWVPVHFELHFFAQTPGEGTSDFDMTLSWEMINSEIPPEVFSYQSFGSPDDVSVLDSTLGTTVEVKPPGGGLSAQASLDSKPKRNVRPQMLLGFALLILLTVAYRLRQWWRRKPLDTPKQVDS